jgi:hypothetical protein
MFWQTTDCAVHAAATISRRRSLVTFGGAALAGGLLAPRPVEAGKAGKAAKKRVKKTCKRQHRQCSAFFADLCQESECHPAGLEAALGCCAKLRTCAAADFLACMAQVDLQEPSPE